MEDTWSAKILPKIKFFIWRVAWAILPTMDILRVGGLLVDGTCCVCGVEHESINHAFFDCGFCLKVWERLCVWVLPAIEEWRHEEDCWEKLII